MAVADVRAALSPTGLGVGTGLRLRRGASGALITSGCSGTEALVESRRLRKVYVQPGAARPDRRDYRFRVKRSGLENGVLDTARRDERRRPDRIAV
jgi:hypothetical protein